MRLFLGSDFHVDYRQNLDWLRALSRADFTDDVLIIAGDLSDELDLVKACFDELAPRYARLLFLPAITISGRQEAGRDPPSRNSRR